MGQKCTHLHTRVGEMREACVCVCEGGGGRSSAVENLLRDGTGRSVAGEVRSEKKRVALRAQVSNSSNTLIKHNVLTTLSHLHFSSTPRADCSSQLPVQSASQTHSHRYRTVPVYLLALLRGSGVRLRASRGTNTQRHGARDYHCSVFGIAIGDSTTDSTQP